MALHGSAMDTDGWFHIPAVGHHAVHQAGAAVLSCDHLPMGSDAARTNAYGTVHKGNTLDGARIQLENAEPFGRELRGVSHVFITKDRPGHLRAHGKPTKIPGKTYPGKRMWGRSSGTTPTSSIRSR